MADSKSMGPIDGTDTGLYRRAVVLVLVSGSVNSVGGLLLRSLEAATDWQIIFYRSTALAASLFVLLAVQYRGRMIAVFGRIGVWGFVGGLLYGAATTGYVLSLTHTTIANTLFILSAIPFFTAALAWALLRESVRRATWIAMAAALAGIAVMVGGGFAAGTVFGNLMALLAALSFSCFVVILRRFRAINMLPSLGLGALVAALTAALMAGGDLAVPAGDIALCLVWGGVLSFFVNAAFIFGARYVVGAEVTLLTLVEFILGPIWVWLFVNEVPSPSTLIGGAIVLSAVAGRALTGMRPRRPIGVV